jgi:hypothetical protein
MLSGVLSAGPMDAQIEQLRYRLVRGQFVVDEWEERATFTEG